MTNRVGFLELFMGPMAGGKTTLACEQATQFVTLGYKTLFVTHAMDKNRVLSGGEKGKYSSHNPSNVKLAQDIVFTSVGSLLDLNNEDYDVIIIDEGQFFTDLVECVKTMIGNGKIVHVYGLSGDYKQEKFGNILDLIPFADRFTQLFAKCMECRRETPFEQPRDAAFTKATQSQTEVIKIGGLTEYQPTCRKHHMIF